MVFITTYSDLYSKPHCAAGHCRPTCSLFLGTWLTSSYYRTMHAAGNKSLLLYIAIFHHQLSYFHTLAGHIYMQNRRQRVRLFLIVLCLLVLKYLTGHISLETISDCKNTPRSMKALFYYV